MRDAPTTSGDRIGEPAAAAVAVATAARFPGVRMPNLGLTDIDVGDLISYLRSETARIEQGNMDDAAMAAHEHGHHD